MKKFALLALAVAATMSCQKDVDPVGPEDNEIKLGASAVELSKAEMATNYNFEAGAQIGVSSILLSQEVLFNSFVSENFGYGHNTPTWTALSTADKLLYQTNPVCLYAYHPYSAQVGSTTVFTKATTGTTAPKLSYTIKADQTTKANLVLSDLMWAKADRSGSGYVKTDPRPINLQFGHLLCKVKFNVSLKDGSQTGTNKSKALLRAITVKGADVLKTATVDFKTGALTAGTDVTELTWKPVAATDAIELETGEGTNKGTTVAVTDMIMIPVAAPTGAEYKMTFNFVWATGYDATLKTGGTETVAFVTVPKTAGTDVAFGTNKNLEFNVVIDKDNKYITLTAAITPWGAAVTHDVEAN